MLPDNRGVTWLTPPGQAMASVAPARPSPSGNQIPASFTQQAATNICGDAVCGFTTSGINLNNILAVPRPPNGMRRTLLIVQNQLVGTQLFYAFGRNADNVSCQFIPAGGNLFLDQLQSIPQNDLFLFFPLAGTVPFTVVNAPLQAAQ